MGYFSHAALSLKKELTRRHVEVEDFFFLKISIDEP